MPRVGNVSRNQSVLNPMPCETSPARPNSWQDRLMSFEHQTPKWRAVSFNCPRCGAFAKQDWYELHGSAVSTGGSVIRIKDPDYTSAVYGVSTNRTPTWDVSLCFACNHYCLWADKALSFPDGDTVQMGRLHEPNEDMPEDARELFSEAVAVLPHSKRAAAALCRAALERLVKHIDPDAPKKARLDERLVRLEGRVSSPTIDLMNVLRHVGNTALHGEQDGDGSAIIYVDEDDETIAETFFLVINTIVDELITKPRRSAELYGTLPESVRKAYESKAGRGGG